MKSEELVGSVKSNKIFLFDNLRLLAIIGVFFIHAYNLPYVNKIDPISRFIEDLLFQYFTRICVPVLFLVSGFLCSKPQKPIHLLQFYRKRIKTLLIPYLTWSIGWLLLYYMIQEYTPLKSYFTLDPIRSLRFWGLIDRIFIWPVPYQFWFIRNLICYILLFPILTFIIKKIGILALGSLFIGWIYYPMGIDLLNPEGLLFFMLGMWISENREYCKRVIQYIGKNSTAIFIAVAISSLISLLIGIKDEYLLYVRKGVIFLLVVSFLLSVFRSKCIVEYSLYGTRYSFFIFAIHEPTMSLFRKLFSSVIIKYDLPAIFGYLCTIIVTLLISYIAAVFVYTVNKKVYSFICGGRS